MRNLRNVHFGRWQHSDITSVCWDPETDDLICTVGPTAESPTLRLLRIADTSIASHRTIASWEAPSPSPELAVDKVLSIQYLSGTGAICLVLEGGDIITVRDDGQSDEDAHIEIVGSIDAGICAARWSPDEELLLIVTKENAIIFMGSSLDPVAEIAMSVDDLKASKHVSVGWGKKETQFQGRGAKALRDPTIPEKVDEGLPSSHDDDSTTISWRGDGAYVAINSAQVGGRRFIRVYSREGELDSASEPVDYLESAMSWRPAGNLIAGIQRLSDRVDVVFFERNGLRHGQFTLRSYQNSVTSSNKIGLEWNSDSTVLAVSLDTATQLWTMGNYHWYLKQEIPKDTTGPCCMSWHSEKALHLAIATPRNIVATEYILRTDRGVTTPPFDTGAVAVVDGNTLKLTSFRTANIPPPYSLFEAMTGTAIIDVAFSRQNTLFAVLHYNGVDIYEWPLKNNKSTKPTLTRSIVFDDQTRGMKMPLRITPTSEDTFRCIVIHESDPSHLTLSARADSATTVESSTNIASTATYDDGATTKGYGQDSTGRLYDISATAAQPLLSHFPVELPWFEMAVTSDGSLIAFGLSRTGHIYANSRLLARNCTSFVVTPDHLIFTTSNHFVKYVHLTEVEELEVPADDPEKDERCRSVERGSRLVTAIPGKASIVLQMPRGNLETIFPRAMVLAAIRKLIDQKDYAGAFALCRTQRVDMNILCDYKPQQFLAHVNLFLSQLQDVAYIDLFLSSLREEDVTQTMYQDTRKHRPQPLEPTHEISEHATTKHADSKVNSVCDALLRGLQSLRGTNLQNIITAHVCKVPPALDDGLLLVAELKKEDEKLAEKAIEHICFLVDVNRLYENALGLYNLELALLVAQQSQRDPREYLPFVQNLHSLPEARRKFEIDDHLARRPKALAHLQTLNSFTELCAYTTKHALYQDALRLYRYDPSSLRVLTDLYASHLEANSCFREAGLAYESLQNYAKATSCYRSAGATCWQECLFAAQQQQSPPLSADAFSELATALADALWEAKNYTAAATIHVEYLASVETAVKCLCKGYHFAEAMRLVSQRSRPDLLTTAVDVGIAEALGSTTEFLADCKAQLQAQLPRILELRQKAADDPLAFYEGDRTGGADLPDDVSVAASSRISTSASLFTRYTGKAGSVGTVGTGVSRATSKNRRREEKKRARGRKGTVYEEEYLVNSVRRLIERVTAAKSEVERLVFALVRRNMAERARNAEALMADLIAFCEVAVAQVFPRQQEMDLSNTGGMMRDTDADGEASWKGRGGDAVLQEWIEGRAKMAEPPIVSQMDKLALLG